MKILSKDNRTKLIMHIAGFIALLWFLIRVIPKPSRAMYPCQRAAFPLASAFVVWLTGLIGSFLSFKRARLYFRNSKHSAAVSFLSLSIIIFGITQLFSPPEQTFANSEQFSMIDFSADSSLVQPKAVVSIIRSNKAKAEDIDSLEICDMVRSAVEQAGGFDTLIHDGSVVVLKPNLITIAQADDNFDPTGPPLPEKVNSVTTDYRIIQAVVNLVREKNPNGKVYVMEGSALGKTRDNMSKMGWFKISGVDEFICLDEACGAWRDTSAKELVKVSLPAGKALYSFASNEYYFNKIFYEADVVISIPVLKTHCNAAITGAVKNIGIGATPINIYGANDSKHWRVDVINHDGYNFIYLHNWIHDYYFCRPVNFAVMDGLTGIENGPIVLTYDPVTQKKKNTRCILASKDPIALDAVASLMVQVDPSKVRHLVTLHNDSLGCNDPKYIRVKGMRVDEVKDHYSSSVTYAQYTDFTSPTVSVNSFRLTDDSLFVSLNASAKVVKVEITVDGEFLAPIITNGFQNAAVKLEKPVSNPGQIKILAYDRYLNCTVVNLQTTDVGANGKSEPVDFALLQNYPNPFNPSTTISYQLSMSGHVELKVFDINGREITTLINREQQAGSYKINFDGSNLSSGVYLCKFNAMPALRFGRHASEFTKTIKMTLIR